MATPTISLIKRTAFFNKAGFRNFLPELVLVVLILSNCCRADTYRSDGEPVLPAPAPVVEDDRPAVGAFAQRYWAHKSPRIVLFWNREMSDETERKKVLTETTESADRYSETETTDVTNSDSGQNKLRELEGFKKNVTVKKTSEEAQDDNQREGLSEKTEFLLRKAVMDKLAAAGVRFIDRAMMIRTTALHQGYIEAQTAETHGLLNQADWLMEVLLVPDGDAPLGYGFRVALKNPRTSSVLSEFYTSALPVIRQQRRFVARHGGFEREPPRQATLYDVADALSRDILREFEQSL
jgi:hypothetical protein